MSKKLPKSKGSSGNNFKADGPKGHFWKMWVVYKHGTPFYGQFQSNDGKWTYYGFFCSGNRQKSYDELLKLYKKREDAIKLAIIYDLETNDEKLRLPHA